MAEPLVLGLVEFLHNLFTTLWIGGLFTLAFIVMPSIKKTLGMTPETKQLTGAIKTRLNKIVWISIVGLFVTGIPLSVSNSPDLFTGFLSFSNTYSSLLSIKHIVVILMVAIVAVRGNILPKMASLPPSKNEKISALLMMANVVLGVVVLLLSGLLATTPLPTP